MTANRVPIQEPRAPMAVSERIGKAQSGTVNVVRHERA
jgi:hypothetical protein